MKTGVHPTYHDDAKVTCSCGETFTMGSTMKELTTELCSKCHPFYTGKQKLVDTAGRVDRFREKMERASKLAKANQKDVKKEEEKEEEKTEDTKEEK